jgi:hypothetical protein
MVTIHHPYGGPPAARRSRITARSVLSAHDREDLCALWHPEVFAVPGTLVLTVPALTLDNSKKRQVG